MPELTRDPYAASARRFKDDTAKHEMTILLDQGLHRHLRFAAPGDSAYWFDLITVPGALIFQGDGESFVFRRLADMFEFFRSNPDRKTLRINPGYWSEKLTNGRDSVKVYSPELFEQLVKEATVDAIRDGSAPRGIGKAVRKQILDDEDICYATGARGVLEDFEHGAKSKLECYRCGQTLEIGMDDAIPADWSRKHPGHVQARTHVEGFRFRNTQEWDLRDYDWWFLWACQAIVWGIAKYDAARDPARSGARDV